MIAKATKIKPEKKVGQEVFCPKCKAILLEANFKTLKIRCRKCGFWVTIDNRR